MYQDDISPVESNETKISSNDTNETEMQSNEAEGGKIQICNGGLFRCLTVILSLKGYNAENSPFKPPPLDQAPRPGRPEIMKPARKKATRKKNSKN